MARVVLVTGEGFAGEGGIVCAFRGSSMLLGLNTTRATVTSSSLVRCASPAAVSEGEVSVEVSRDGMEYSRGGMSFRYIQDAEVTGVQPSSGPERGGQSVTVTGQHFLNTAGLVCRSRRVDSGAGCVAVIDKCGVCAAGPAAREQHDRG